MTLVTLKKVLDSAYQNGYAVGAFNRFNLDFVEAVTLAADRKASPVIINIAEAHFQFATLEHITPAILAIAYSTRFDVVLNLDHGLTFGAIERAIANHFTSIMFDGSRLDFDENVRQTREVVKMCHALNISVEGELGVIGGEEKGGKIGTADPNKYTDILQAKEFARETKVDALAVAIGNCHGLYKGEPDLDFQRLQAIRDVVDVPLVLHGGSGISAADFRKAISMGIAKINFFTGLTEAAIRSTTSFVQKIGERYNDYPLLLADVKENVASIVENQMDIFGSTGKAA